MSRIIKAPYINLDSENKVNIEVLSRDKFFPGAQDEQGQEAASVTASMIMESAKTNANSFIEGARTEAARIMNEAREHAREEAENIKIEAKEIAQKKGYEEGYRKGEEEANRLIEKANAYQAQIEEELKQKQLSLEPQIVSLIIDLCKSIVGNNIKFNSEAILFAVKKGMSQAQKLTEVNIRVSQDDYETLLNNRDNILSALDSSAKIEIVRDATLTVGDCIIETPYGDVDSSITRQLDGLIADLNVIFDKGDSFDRD